jgi:hypothetical protein
MYLSPWSGAMRKFRHPRLGAIVTPSSDRGLPLATAWAADNGCFSQGDRFDLSRFYDWLDGKAEHRADCLFAVAPDVVGDAASTWTRSASVLSEIRARRFPAALVAQDGFDAGRVDWDAFDALFIGGAKRIPEWKRSEAGGYAAIAEGKRRGKWVHVGRVNGGAYLRNLADAGADSADGTKLKFGPDLNWPLVCRWLDSFAGRPSLELFR